MTDPLDALRLPDTPVVPDPAFAARLRRRLAEALTMTDPEHASPRGAPMSDVTDVHTTDVAADGEAELAMSLPPTLTPYIAVGDARRALDWYGEVFAATRRGEPYVMPDGSIGHAELGIGDAVLMLAEGSHEVPVQPPTGSGPFSHTLHVQVDDVDGTVRRAEQAGALVERRPVDQPYGRVAVIVDPFGHRWMLNKPPTWATPARHGDIAYVTIGTPDDERAKAFYGTVLGWRFSRGSVPRGWNVDGRQPQVGLWGGAESSDAQLCYRVADAAAAAQRVRSAGGTAGAVERKPYGLFVECVDDQGMPFQLWQPVD